MIGALGFVNHPVPDVCSHGVRIEAPSSAGFLWPQKESGQIVTLPSQGTTCTCASPSRWFPVKGN